MFKIIGTLVVIIKTNEKWQEDIHSSMQYHEQIYGFIPLNITINEDKFISLL